MTSTMIITLPKDSGVDQILVRDTGEVEVDVRRKFGVWTPISLAGGSFEVVK